MAKSKYFPDLSNGNDIADVEQVEKAFTLVETDMDTKMSSISDGSVTTDKIADGAITNAKLGKKCVESDNLADDLEINGDFTVGDTVSADSGSFANSVSAEFGVINNELETGTILSYDDVVIEDAVSGDSLHKLSEKADTSDVLTKTNTSEYIPTESYHPATKKYAEKYADGIMENLKKLSVPQRKAEGNPLAITDGLADEAPLELKVYGNYGKNLIPYPYANTTKTENGITFTDNGDGTVTVNGTATANSQVWFTLNTNVEKLLDVTKTYVMSYVMSGGSNSNVFLYMSFLKDNNWVGEIGAWSSAGVKINLSTVTKEYDTIKLSIGVMKGTAVDSITIKPQLKLYEALGDLNSSSGKYEVQVSSTGKNLIPYPYANTTKTENGITFTDNGDGSITINGTATNTTFCHLLPTNKKNLSPGKYIHTDNASKETDFHFSALVRKNSTNVIVSSSGTSFDISDIDYDFVWYVMTIKEGDTVDNVTYKPQLELGETATEYEPYVSGGDVTAAMGSQLKPGEYIDLLRKKKISNGTETDISVSGGIKIPESEMCYIKANTKISPEKIEVTYFQDINKVIGEIKKSILSQGGNV